MDRNKPDYRIYDAGALISREVEGDLIQITVDDALDGAAIATIKLRDDRFKYSSGDKFKVGNQLKVELGYVGQTTAVFDGEVTAWQGAFPRRGNPTLVVIAQDKFHRLRRNRRQKTYLEMKDSDAVSQVCQEAGLTASTETTPIKQDSIIQWNQTDADFVLERAALFGYEVYVEGSQLKFQKPKLSDGPKATVVWKEALRTFQVSISLGRQHKKLKLTAWDAANKATLTANAQKGDERNLMGATKVGAEIVEPVDGEPAWLTTTPAKTQEEVDAYAKAAFALRSERFLVGEGTCQGDPKIRRGTVVKVDEIGQYLSGPYYVRRAIHTFLPGSGYTTTFRVVRTATQAPAPPPQKQPQQAQQQSELPPPEPVPLVFEVGDPGGAPLEGAPYVLRDPDGNAEAGELDSSGKVELEFEE